MVMSKKKQTFETSLKIYPRDRVFTVWILISMLYGNANRQKITD